jgi:phospholipid-translocating ATPase
MFQEPAMNRSSDAPYAGTSLYEQWSLSMFNTLFTSLVVIFLGVFEQDLRASTLIAVPELYTKGQRSLGFNLWVFSGWILMGLADALIIYFSMTELYARAGYLQVPGLFPIGQLTFTACVIVIAIKTQVIEQRYRSYMAFIAIFASVGGWFLWNIILSAIYGKNNQYDVKGGFLTRFGRSALWWLVLVLSVSACVLFEIAVRAIKSAIMPTDVEIFQTLEQDLDVRRRFEEASAPWMQAGWDHGSKKSSIELRRDAEEQRARESAVQELLERPRTLEDGHGPGPKGFAVVQTEEHTVVDRNGTDIQDILARRQGSVLTNRGAA